MRSSAIDAAVRKTATRRDMISIFCILAATAVAALATMSLRGGQGASIEIRTGQERYGGYSLDKDQVIEIEQPSGYNRIVIRDGTVYMEAADCPDRYCVAHRPVSRGGETIVCLPHKVVVEVVGRTGGQQPDAVAQ